MDELPVIDPLYHIDAAALGVASIDDVLINPVRPTVFVFAQRDLIDPILVFLAYWPWIVTIAGVPLALGMLWRLRHVLARPQHPGRPYCRACNYELSGHVDPAKPCPECGRSVAGRATRIGRSAFRRLALTAGPLLAALLAMVALTIPLVYTGAGGVPQWTPLWIDRLARSAGAKPAQEHVRRWPMLQEIDCASGGLLHSCFLERRVSAFATAFSSDAARVILEWEGRLICLDTRTGRILADLAYPGEILNRPDDQGSDAISACLGFSDDGASAYLYGADHGYAPQTHLLRWTFAANLVEELLRTETTIARDGTIEPFEIRRTDSDGCFLIRSPDSVAATLFDARSGVRKPAAWPRTQPQSEPPSRSVVHELRPLRMVHTFTFHPGGRLAAGARRDSVALADLSQRRWVAQLALPPSTDISSLKFASNPDYLVGTTRPDVGSFMLSLRGGKAVGAGSGIVIWKPVLPETPPPSPGPSRP